MEPLSNPDTNGAEESVIVGEVSSFQRLKCMQEWYLGWEKVSRPHFRGVLVWGLHCSTTGIINQYKGEMIDQCVCVCV